jgi:hypothetical protein
MDETGAFLEVTTARYRDAETALHKGDAAPRKAMWARTEPVTLLGAALSAAGWEAIEPLFDRLQARFSNCSSCEHEVIAAGASGDLAYIVAFEHTTASSTTRPRCLTRFEPPPCSAARTGSGRLSTATPTRCHPRTRRSSCSGWSRTRSRRRLAARVAAAARAASEHGRRRSGGSGLR